MHVLITGASGFLGRYVVSEAVRRGHEVTALIRPSRQLPDNFFPPDVRVMRADLRDKPSLRETLQDIEAVIHLAACVAGDDDAQFANTVVGTENLLDAMIEQNVSRLVHCSTFSVYNWQQSGLVLDEDSELEPNLYARDGYAISKTWQERIASEFSNNALVGLYLGDVTGSITLEGLTIEDNQQVAGSVIVDTVGGINDSQHGFSL